MVSIGKKPDSKQILQTLLKTVDEDKKYGNHDGRYLNTKKEIERFKEQASIMVKYGSCEQTDVDEILEQYKNTEMAPTVWDKAKKYLKNNDATFAKTETHYYSNKSIKEKYVIMGDDYADKSYTD